MSVLKKLKDLYARLLREIELHGGDAPVGVQLGEEIGVSPKTTLAKALAKLEEEIKDAQKDEELAKKIKDAQKDEELAKKKRGPRRK